MLTLANLLSLAWLPGDPRPQGRGLAEDSNQGNPRPGRTREHVLRGRSQWAEAKQLVVQTKFARILSADRAGQLRGVSLLLGFCLSDAVYTRS